MGKWLVRLPAGEPTPQTLLECWRVEADGRTQSLHQSMADIQRSQPTQLLAVVPAAQLAWHAAVLPVGIRLRGDNRLQAVLQNQLEEGLLEDSSLAHVALAPDAVAGAPSLAAVCRQDWLSGWLKTLEAAQLKVARVLPEVPPEMLATEGVCTAFAHCTWVTQLHAGLPLTLPLSAETNGLVAATPFQALPAAYTEAARCLGADSVRLISEADYVQALLHSSWDLAQHQLSSTPLERWRRKAKAWAQELMLAPEWRAARVGMYALALVAVLGLNALVWEHQRALERKQALVVETVQRAFPQIRVVVDGPLQMQREMQNLRVAAGVLSPQDLQPLLSAAGTALDAGSSRPTTVEYTGSELLLSGLPVPDVAAVQAKLQGTGYSASAAGNTLRVQAGG